MLFKNRFTIAKLLWLIALVAVIVSNGQTWISFCVLQLLIIFAISEILVMQFPSGIRHVMNSNCVRLDGSISSGRKRIELRQLSTQRINVILLLTVICLFTSLVFWFIYSGAYEYLTGQKQMTPAVLAVPEQGQIAFLKDAAESLHAEKETSKQVVARNYFYIACFLGTWLIAVFLVFKSAYFYLLKQLMASAHTRASDYRLRDMRKMMEASEQLIGS